MAEHLGLSGKASSVVGAIPKLQFTANEYYHGDVTVLIRTYDWFSGAILDSVALPLTDTKKYHAPEFSWRLRPLVGVDLDSTADPTRIFQCYEDADMFLSSDFDYSDYGGIMTAPTSTDAIAVNTVTTALLNNQLRGLQISFAFTGIVHVTIEVHRGAISVDRIAPLVSEYSDVTIETSRLEIVSTLGTGTISATQDDGSSMLYLSGDIFAVNEILDRLKYQGKANQVGNDYMNVSLWETYSEDSAAASLIMTSILSIRIIPRNDAPVISINGTELGLFYQNESMWEVGVIEGLEDEYVYLGQYFDISDPDLEAQDFLESETDTFWSESHRAYYDGLAADHLLLHISDNGELSSTVRGSSLTFLTYNLKGNDTTAAASSTDGLCGHTFGTCGDTVSVIRSQIYHAASDRYHTTLSTVQGEHWHSQVR